MESGLGPSERAKSFGHALRGIATLLREEPNARIHAAATAGVIGLGLVLGLPIERWPWLVAAMALVWCAEAINTALERLADATAPERSRLVGQSKDVAAGGVLIASIAAAVIGVLVLGPPLLDWLRALV
jgi:diacylglycerol kinase (ATP)